MHVRMAYRHVLAAGKGLAAVALPRFIRQELATNTLVASRVPVNWGQASRVQDQSAVEAAADRLAEEYLV